MNLHAIPVFLLLVFFASCYKGNPGCNDVEATNFDPAADYNNGTCAYYQLKLDVKHVYRLSNTDTTFALNKKYADDSQDTFVVKQLKLYLTDLELVRADNSVESVSDTLVINVSGTPQTISNNFALLKVGTTSYSMGRLSGIGSFVKVRFKLGLPIDIPDWDLGSLLSSHPLRDTSMVRVPFFRNMLLEYQMRGATNISTLVWEGSSAPMQYEFPISLTVPTRSHALIGIQINWKRVLSGVRFDLNTASANLQIIKNNLQNEISIY